MSAPSQVIESPHSVDIPVSDIPSWVFSAGTPSTRMSPQYFNADNPKECFSLSEAELYVKRVARGLQMLGLRPDDKVMLYSPNQLFVPILLWGVIAARCVFTAISPTASKTGQTGLLSCSALFYLLNGNV
jgi:long-subunit acyl-CoA synthetase (AMP-forming)